MANRIGPPIGPPLGFPECPQCSYLSGGPPALCLACSRKSFENVAATACPICSQLLEDGTCRNRLCRDQSRRISRIRAIAYSSGDLRETILRYKYNGKHGWSLIFGRILVAWLDRNAREQPPELIIANPTFTGAGAFGHTERVIETAATEDALGEWPFDTADPRVLVKLRATSKSANTSAAAKRATATELRDAISIPDRSRTEGRRVLIYDDICTTGSQLNTVAGYLIDDGGATDVEAIVLARAPWRPRS